MTFDAIDIFEVLEPMLDDYRKLRYRALGELGRAGVLVSLRAQRPLTDVSDLLPPQTARSPFSRWTNSSTSCSRKSASASCSFQESRCAKCSRRRRVCHGDGASSPESWVWKSRAMRRDPTMEAVGAISAGRRAQAGRRRAAMAGGTCLAARLGAMRPDHEAGVAAEAQRADIFQDRLHRLAMCRGVQRGLPNRKSKLWRSMRKAVYVTRRGKKAACCCYIITARKGYTSVRLGSVPLVVRELGIGARGMSVVFPAPASQ